LFGRHWYAQVGVHQEPARLPWSAHQDIVVK
jgi:hypothetical protein